jgi:hypothetical protein
MYDAVTSFDYLNASLMKTLTTIAMLIISTSFAISQNVGIGTSSPTQKLDVAGRVHLRHNSGQSAGIWYDGPTLSNRSFIGTYNEDHVGFYGSISGWKLVMNVESGNVGIGNANPSASLDVSGTMRYRGSTFPNLPGNGALLTSVDDDGNAEWQRPVMFKTNGLDNDLVPAPFQWTKILFKSTGLEVNEGFHYNFTTSVFNAPVRGFYHFDTKAYIFSSAVQSYLRIVVVRNGNLIREFRDANLLCETCLVGETRDYNEFSSKIRYKTLSVSVGTVLEKNDQVWVEVYRSKYDNESVSALQVMKEANATWFNGHLVNRF